MIFSRNVLYDHSASGRQIGEAGRPAPTIAPILRLRRPLYTSACDPRRDTAVASVTEQHNVSAVGSVSESLA